MRTLRSSPLLLLPVLLAAGAAADPATLLDRGAPSYAMEAVVLTGQPAPDGGAFTEFSDPSLNNHGDLAFGGLTTSPKFHVALYLRAGGTLRTLVTAGRAAPTGGTFQIFNDVLLNDRQTVVFLGRTSDRVAHQGLYFVRAASITPIVATGQPAPSGGAFTDFANPTLNTHDVVAFVGRMTGPAREGIFTSVEGSITPVVLSGQQAPTGGTFQFFLDGTPALNDPGQIAFTAATTDRATLGIYVVVEGEPVPVVTTDDEAPGGGSFGEFGFVNLTNAGTVGFVGRSPQSPIREALYVTGRAGLIRLARQGQAVSGEVLTTFVNSVMNSEEVVVFEQGTPDPIPRAIFAATRGGVRPVVRAGDLAPSGQRFTAFDAPAVNDRGEIAFVAETADGRHGIYLVTPK